MTKFSINSFHEDLDQVLYIPDYVFIADNRNDQDTYNLILSFTHFFNNLRDVAIISQLVDSETKEVKTTNNSKFGQFSGMKIFADNLFFAYILEFMQLLKSDDSKKIISNVTFNRIIKITNKKPREDWKQLLKIIYSSNNKLFNTLLKIRNNLSFHYFQPKKLFEGYKMAIQNPKNKMYLSLGKKMSGTRYYFCDLANQLAIYKIIEDNNFSLEEWGKEIENLVNLILSVTMNIIKKFIILRGAPSATKTEEIQPIESFLRKLKN